MINFYLDEHVATAVTKALRRRDVDVLTTPEAGTIGASDRDHLAFAHREGRVLMVRATRFTRDADFLRLHAEGISHGDIGLSDPVAFPWDRRAGSHADE